MMILGHLDLLKDNNIMGWLGTNDEEIQPFITANGKACKLLAYGLIRPDVAEATGLHAAVGYVAEVPHLIYGAIDFNLYAIAANGMMQLIDQKTITGGVIYPTRLSSVFDALDVARKKDSIALVCGDRAHDSIDTAKVVYDLIAPKRPAVIIAFEMDFTAADIWPPVFNSDTRLLIIPWKNRSLYFDLFKEIGLHFNTLWICEPCQPAYELARHITHEKNCFIQNIDNNGIAIDEGINDANEAIGLPEYSYKQFEALKIQAKENVDSFRKMLSHSISRLIVQKKRSRNIVLLWKQHDAGLYGRRIDQIARALAASENYDQVTVLEIMTEQQLHSYQADRSRTDSDRQYIYADFFDKKLGTDRNGINYKCLFIDETGSLTELFNRFLLENKLYPSNTVFVLFPVITGYEQILACIDGYPCICDVVDNQLSWSRNNPFPLLQQYASMCSNSQKIVFNSEINKHFFIANGLCDPEHVELIPNWYKAPGDVSKLKGKPRKATFDILYSGNLNDRIDWDLLQKTHDATDNTVRIHLVGCADRAQEKVTAIIAEYKRFVCHGPLREENLLQFAKTCDLAIMPHLHDDHSNFMSPLKLHMYAAIQLHCISTQVPGIAIGAKHLTLCDNHELFIEKVNAFIQSPFSDRRWFSFDRNKHANQYLKVIKEIVTD